MSTIKIENMIKDERSLLLYLECQAVDYGGKIDSRRMNGIDFDIAHVWDETGFIRFGRIKASDIAHNFDHWCILSDDAWVEAHRERRARNNTNESNLSVHRNGYDE